MTRATALATAMARYPRWLTRGDFIPADHFKNGVTKHRKRKNKQPCPECGATDLVYRWVKHPWRSVVEDSRWFCFCGRTEVDD